MPDNSGALSTGRADPSGMSPPKGEKAMTLLLIVLLVRILAGSGWGYRTGLVAWPNPLSIILLVLVIFLIVGLLTPKPRTWF